MGTSNPKRKFVALAMLGAAWAAALPAAVVPARADALPLPVLALEVSSLSLGAQQAGTASLPQPLLVRNDGTATLYLDSIVAAGAYAADASACPAGPGAGAPGAGAVAALEPGARCAVLVTFVPPAVGQFLGSLTVTSGGESLSIPLEGLGTRRAPLASFDEGGVEFSPQLAGTRSAPNSSPCAISATSRCVRAGSSSAARSWRSTWAVRRRPATPSRSRRAGAA